MSEPKKRTSYAAGNKFYILGEFDEDLIPNIILPLDEKIEEIISDKNSKREIEIHINSEGGYVYLLDHLVELVEKAKKNGIIVKTFVFSMAYSCGSLLSVVGSEGHRYIGRNAEHLIHYGEAGGIRLTTKMQVERLSERTKRDFEKIEQHYEKYAKVPSLNKNLRDDMFYIPADKCIEYKLADKYIDEIK